MIYFENIFTKNNKLINILKNYEKIVIITDSNIFNLYAEKLNKIFLKNKLDSKIIQFPAGEKNKNRETKYYLENKLFEYNCHKRTCIVALGGGVTTDLAGFVAATYFRGIDAVFIPTSLLAMVDAAIGGKNGVNTEYGKNTIGTIKQPKYIFIDINFLETLDKEEYKFAFAEIIKHAIILDENYFDYLMKVDSRLRGNDETAESVIPACPVIPAQAGIHLLKIIKKSCEIKNNIIKQDAAEKNIREILNFGHTIGHAIEKTCDYKVSHGQAVAMGIAAESYISHKFGLLNLDNFNKILNILKVFDLIRWIPACAGMTKPHAPSFPRRRESILKNIFHDKKTRNNKPRIVLIKNIGEVFHENNKYAHEVPEEIIKESLEYLCL